MSGKKGIVNSRLVKFSETTSAVTWNDFDWQLPDPLWILVEEAEEAYQQKKKNRVEEDLDSIW